MYLLKTKSRPWHRELLLHLKVRGCENEYDGFVVSV